MSSDRALEGFPRNRPLLASSEKANASYTRGASAARGAAVASVWPPDWSEEKSVVEPGSGSDSGSQATSSSELWPSGISFSFSGFGWRLRPHLLHSV